MQFVHVFSPCAARVSSSSSRPRAGRRSITTTSLPTRASRASPPSSEPRTGARLNGCAACSRRVQAAAAAARSARCARRRSRRTRAIRWFHVPRFHVPRCGTTVSSTLARLPVRVPELGRGVARDHGRGRARTRAPDGRDVRRGAGKRRAAAVEARGGGDACCEPFYGVRDPTPRAQAEHQRAADAPAAPRLAAAARRLFRDPEERLLSAFAFHRHAWRMPPWLRGAEAAFAERTPSPGRFARAHGVAACASKMLVGEHCGGPLRSVRPAPRGGRRELLGRRGRRAQRAPLPRSRARAARGSSSARSRRRERARTHVGGVGGGARGADALAAARGAARGRDLRARRRGPRVPLRRARRALERVGVPLPPAARPRARAPPRAGARPRRREHRPARVRAHPDSTRGEGGARAGSGGAAPLRAAFVDVRDELVYAMALARFELDMRAALGRPKPPWASDVDSGAGF